MSKTKKKTPNKKMQIVKLYCNPDDESESEYSEEYPEKIISKLTTTKIETVNTNMHKMFNIEDTDVLVLIDKNNDYWYKAKDIATILAYTNTAGAIKRHVSKEYRKSFACIGCRDSTPLKIDPQTTFVDDSGLIQLVSRSPKPEAMKLWRKITKEILPTLFATGSYSLPLSKNEEEELNKNFYDDNTIMSYKDRNAIYLAYIGKYKGIHILKFGKTKDFINIREKQHVKTYKLFNVLKIWETLACDHAEDNIKTEFRNTKLLVKINSKNLNMNCPERINSELVRINEVKNLQYVINKIDHIINTTILPKEQKYIDTIKDLTHQAELTEIKLQHNNETIDTLRRRLDDKDNIIALLNGRNQNI